jgi:MYXO-CTERM domain-containing protein
MKSQSMIKIAAAMLTMLIGLPMASARSAPIECSTEVENSTDLPCLVVWGTAHRCDTVASVIVINECDEQIILHEKSCDEVECLQVLLEPGDEAHLPINYDHGEDTGTQYNWTMGEVTGVITAHERIADDSDTMDSPFSMMTVGCSVGSDQPNPTSGGALAMLLLGFMALKRRSSPSGRRLN